MRTLSKIFLWILAIVAVLVIIAYLLPKTYKVERSVYIRADKNLVYELAANLTKWKVWTPWTKQMDSTAVFEFTGDAGQVGSGENWSGKKMGSGELVITELKPGELVAYDLMFDKGKYQSKGEILFEQAADSLKVTWIDRGDLGYNPVARYMGLTMDRMMGPGFEQGLAKLKKVSEERMGWPRIEETLFPAQIAVLIRDSAGPADFASKTGAGFGEIISFTKANKLTCSGYPFAIYLKWDSVTKFSVFDMGIAVDKLVSGSGRVRVESIPEQKVVQAYYFGPCDKTYGAYMALDQYIRQCELEEAGGPWEIYVTDPMTEKDTSKWETRIAFPVK